MSDERLIEAMAIEIKRVRALEVDGCFGPADYDEPDDCANGACYCAKQCRAEAEAALAAIRASGYAIVPMEGEGFRAAVKRAVDRHNRKPRVHVWTHVPRMTEALRAALTPGDDTNG